VTFHPKLYLFSGYQQAVCFYGSHNLTVGGTETNFEGGVKIEFERPADDETFIQALDCWESLLPERCKSTLLLDEELLDKLSRGGFLLDENKGSPLSRGSRSAISLPSAAVSTSLFPLVPAKPPSAIPRNLIAPSASRKDGTAEPAVSGTVAHVPAGYNTPASRIFVIQIIPHTNGEVHLSKIAIDQNPSFFDFPFAGLVVPKKSSNPPYHQRLPDPRVDIEVYDANGELILQKVDFPLNTVYYDDNAELRVTISPDLLRVIPPYSMMVMVKEPDFTLADYDISIFVPGSQQFQDYLAACNQTLPSGGKPQPRKMGWL
jgi:hypothetical protein